MVGDGKGIAEEKAGGTCLRCSVNSGGRKDRAAG
jgi:hypothetical protein